MENKSDLKLQQGQTLENIMDYLPGAQKTYKSFITYQWDKMREYLQTNKNTVEELGIKISEKKQNYWMYLEDFQKNSTALLLFSSTILRYIVNNSEDYYKNNDVQFEISNQIQENILLICKEAIENQVNILCST